MGYQRANWHSGLNYVQTCEGCNTKVMYTDYYLEFRPWYADGFVYGPTCKKPLRHRETYAINPQAPGQQVNLGMNQQPQSGMNQQPQSQPMAQGEVRYCTACGYEFKGHELFCPMCGKKR